MTTHHPRWTPTMATVAVFAALVAALAVRGVPRRRRPRVDPLASLHWRFIGPNGNRAAAIAGEPGNPMVDYVGAASGGVWKTENGGVSWKPVFDHEKVSAIGALAVADSAPHTRLGRHRRDVAHPALLSDGRRRLQIDRRRAITGSTWASTTPATSAASSSTRTTRNRVFVCALGQLFKPQPERGVYRTLDGGKTWTQVLKVDEKTGCSDLAMDPRDPNTLYAGMWPLLIHPWNLDSGGPDRRRLHHARRRRDVAQGGRARHAGGRSSGRQGRRRRGAQHPHRVYALVQDTQPTLYRSDDRGQHVDARQPFAPDGPARLVLRALRRLDDRSRSPLLPQPQLRHLARRAARRSCVRTRDGFASAGGDNHDIWIDPGNANRIMVANDAGASISLDGSRTFQQIRLPIAQVYHVTTDDQIPYNIYGNIQDGNSFRGPSNNLQTGGFGGGGIHAGRLPVGRRLRERLRHARSLRQRRRLVRLLRGRDQPHQPARRAGARRERLARRRRRLDAEGREVPLALDGAARDLALRFEARLRRQPVRARDDRRRPDAGRRSARISRSTTRAHQGDSGGISFDNLYTYDGDVIYSIAESPKKAGRDLGRHQRRSGQPHRGRRRALDQRHEADSEPAAVRARSGTSSRRRSTRRPPTSP